MPATRRILPLALFLILGGSAFSQEVTEESSREATADVARRIVLIAGLQRPLALTVRNLSSASADEFLALRRTLEAELQSHGMRLEAALGSVGVQVTLAENVQGFLWIAQIFDGDQPFGSAQERQRVVIRAFPGPAEAAPEISIEPLQLEQKFLWQQKSSVLDAAVTEPGQDETPQMVVLTPGRLALYRQAAEGWELRDSLPITRTTPWPRDPRGRIEMDRGIFTLFLPGMECGGTLAPRLGMDCREMSADEAVWTLRNGEENFLVARFDPRRNFFVGPLFPDSQTERPVPPFFSGATFRQAGETWLLLAGTDGKTRLYGAEPFASAQDKPEPEAEFNGWGSEIAAIRSDCVQGWHVLATRPGDWQQLDAVRAYRIVETRSASSGQAEAVAASPPSEFSGPVISLRTAADGQAAIAIVRNLRTRRYEAYTISIACSR